MSHPTSVPRRRCSPLARAGILLCLSVLTATRALPQVESRSGEAEIESITFEGNHTLEANELQSQMATRETPGFFNRFLYNSISEKLGRKNEYFNSVTFDADVERLRKYFQNRGFLDVKLDTMLTFSPDQERVDIKIVVQEGYRSLIDSIVYRGIVNAPGTIWRDIAAAPKISQGDPFNSTLVEEEVRRVMHILANTGYPNAAFVRDSSSATRYASTKNFLIIFTFRLGKQYHFGDITIQQEAGTPPRKDITDDIVLRQLDYAPGVVYSVDDSVSSVRNLNRLGVFDLRRLSMNVPPPRDTSTAVPSVITLRPRDKHELAPELIVSNENDALNLGAGLGYTNRNFFGGARTFSTRARFRTQTIEKFPNVFGATTDAVSNLDLTFELVQPYMFTNKMKGTWSFSLIFEKQKPFRQNIVRNIFGVTNRLAEFTTGYLDWTLEAVNFKMNPNFVVDSTDLETLAQLNQLIERQFNSILSFTLQRDKSNDIFSPSAGFIHSITLEEAGIFPLVLKRAIPNLPFTQFYRVNLLGRWYTDLTSHRFAIAAFKLKGGFEEKYGESRSNPDLGIPQTHRFYAGGGGSVRGWASRELIASGPPQLGGDLSFEGSVELRTNLLQNLHDGLFDKIWIVQFFDFGNLWRQVDNFRIKDIAMAAGLGLRYDTFFGPFRFDWGFRVYDPAQSAGQQWITQRKLFGQTFKEGVFHFGIGHAF